MPMQLNLELGIAEEARQIASDDRRALPRRKAQLLAPPKPGAKGERAEAATMEAVTERLRAALGIVVRNKGAPGPDRWSVE
jgi:hypothetical protein